jgi:hypothetical protein
LLALCGCDPVGSTFFAKPLVYDSGKAVRLTIRDENARLGDSEWQLSNPAEDHEIEGYASATSVNRGDGINLFVSTADASYSIEIYRMGWYGGAGGRRVLGPVLQRGIAQSAPIVNSRTRQVECDWVEPYVLHTSDSDPKEWVSGVYLAKLTASHSGKQSYIIFVVRDEKRTSDLLFQTSVTTYQAYNSWGGYSLYSKPRATHVSFNRPYRDGHGSGQFTAWESRMLRFLEREGYDVTYATDIDSHERGELLTMHKGFLSVGHDEYWSWANA